MIGIDQNTPERFRAKHADPRVAAGSRKKRV
jgi:hypothetical protein